MGRNYHDTQFDWDEEQHQQLDFTVQQLDTSFKSLFPFPIELEMCACVWAREGQRFIEERLMFRISHIDKVYLLLFGVLENLQIPLIMTQC